MPAPGDGLLNRKGIVFKNVGIWLPGYLKSLFKPRRRVGGGGLHVLFACVDHFEPLYGGVDEGTGERRIARWIEAYESMAAAHRDCSGRLPRHTYFFPIEESRDRFIRLLAEHCARGFGEFEIHLHHDNDTAEHLERTINDFKNACAKRGLLGTDSRGRARYGFVHGNWALDNSGPGGRFCGVNNELTVLHRTGCYADFTLPSAPSPAQTRTINAVYYAMDDPERPKSHDRGVPVRVHGSPPAQDGCLMIIQGPLTFDWTWRRGGVLPRIENSEIASWHPPMGHRWKLWIRSAPSVAGRPDWIFVKAAMHGCVDESFDEMFVREGFRRLYEGLASIRREYCDLEYHFVTAREMYNVVKAAEAGEEGNPFQFIDYEIRPPRFESSGGSAPG
jgi:hypothetical protein